MQKMTSNTLSSDTVVARSDSEEHILCPSEKDLKITKTTEIHVQKCEEKDDGSRRGW